MKDALVTEKFQVVDLFAGPGGLAEGFSAYRAANRAPFQICLSVEKEKSAFETLRLRSFTRQFSKGLPPEYYAYLAKELSHQELVGKYKREWASARAETRQLELGTEKAARELDPVLDVLRHRSARKSILLGGPPCQAYSLVGRARNRGIQGYSPADDHRHFLYREYIRILGRLMPAVFIMENVKGFLSSSVDGQRIFDSVLRDLRSAGGAPDSYRIIPLVRSDESDGREFVVRSELFGIPQSRHRVILCGVRQDLAAQLPDNLSLLTPEASSTTVSDVLSSMPRVRSGLSKKEDTPENWRTAVLASFAAAAAAASGRGDEIGQAVHGRLAEYSQSLETMATPWGRKASAIAPVSNNALATWLIDPRLGALPNHETRGHMDGDLARYAYAAVFAEITGQSPNAGDFPAVLAPAHANWTSGKFADRFRVQCWGSPSTTVTSHISKDGHYFIHPDALQCRSLTVREAARLQTFPDNYLFEGNRTQQFVQVGNAVPPLLAYKIAGAVYQILALSDRERSEPRMAEFA